MSKADRTKQFIIEKTAPIFNTKGYAGTSLTDMTDATGLTKGSIYGNFENKDEVACAAFDHNLKGVQAMIREEMDKRVSVRDKLLVYVDVYGNFLKAPFPQGGCPILNTAIEADDTHPVLKEKALHAVNAWKERIVSLLQDGMEKGELGHDVNPEQVALTIIAMVEGSIMISRLSGKPNYRKLILESVENYIRGLE